MARASMIKLRLRWLAFVLLAAGYFTPAGHRQANAQAGSDGGVVGKHNKDASGESVASEPRHQQKRAPKQLVAPRPAEGVTQNTTAPCGKVLGGLRCEFGP